MGSVFQAAPLVTDEQQGLGTVGLRWKSATPGTALGDTDGTSPAKSHSRDACILVRS